MSGRTRGGALGQRGFVLVTAVWVLAALVLLVDYVTGVAVAHRERAELARRSLQDDLDARGTEATVLYLLSTGRMNYRGLVLERQQRFRVFGSSVALPPGEGVLGADGTPYFGVGRIRFSVQDEDGLASLNKLSVIFPWVMRHAGLSALDVDRLIPRIADYVDLGSALELNGAEASDYEIAGRQPPSNWFMASPMELKRVLGASEMIPPERWNWLRRVTTTAINNTPNFNTMPVELLAALFAGDEAAARRVAQHRERAPLTGIYMVNPIAGYDLPATGDFSPHPSKRLRIALWRVGDRRRTVIGVTMTPGSVITPWRKEYRYIEPVAGGSAPYRQAETPLFQPV